MPTPLVYAVELEVYDPGLPGTAVKYFSTDLGFTTGPSDTPANTTFEPKVAQPALLRRDMFTQGATGGQSQIGFGELVLNNANGDLDGYLGYGMDGRTLVVRVGTPGTAYPAAWTTLFRGTMEQPVPALSQLTVRLRDRQLVATKPLNPTKYAGTNALPLGIEGLASDLKGKPKPVLYGWCFNVSPVQVNTSKLIYQLHDGALKDVQAVYDAGYLLTRQTPDYANQSDMETNQPRSGYFRVCPSLGCFRLGAAPFGQVTADAIEGDSPTERTVAQIYKRILMTRGGLASGDISASDLVTHDAANNATVGLFVGAEETTIGEALDRLVQTTGSFWASDAAGIMRLQRLENPASGTPVTTFTRDAIKDLRFSATSDQGAGLPTWRVTVRGVPNYTVQTTGLVGAVSSDRKARLAQPYQDAVDSDSAVQTVHPFAVDQTVETCFSCLDDAVAEAARRIALHKVRRDRLELEVELDPAVIALIDLGVAVTVTYPRYGYSGGKIMRVLGYQLDPRRKRANLTLWG